MAKRKASGKAKPQSADDPRCAAGAPMKAWLMARLHRRRPVRSFVGTRSAPHFPSHWSAAGYALMDVWRSIRVGHGSGMASRGKNSIELDNYRR